METFSAAQETLDFLRPLIHPELQKPHIAIICGSGLGLLADSVQPDLKSEIYYKDIPNFPKTTVHGHAGKLVFGYLAGSKTPLVFMVGRSHYYEGNSIHDITFPVRVFKLLGVETIIVTNAAGALNSDYQVGDVVLINDHINLPGLSGLHPLRGPNDDHFGTRFPALSDAYDLRWRRDAHNAWKKVDLRKKERKLHEGVYAFLSGPTYETRAECRLLKALGVDLVGMSTVPEVIVARHCGIRVLAISLVTNRSVLDPVPRGDNPKYSTADQSTLDKELNEGKANHEEVIEAGREAASDMQTLVSRLILDDPKT